ncbi:Leader peptidase (Prepilin peptidase) / N-methyltransferase [Thioalkalivibrio nitratireducens DSM 14787]|uniref:Prepilin leader peptidase/N-methyltransferase n=1 Tax=Thioalkalivibrio nitratireducens (strain DSM 14787 / UNIQEM 213 / ALEN2) TaxID=1255043 RepID=L0E0Q1_THIND|nr:A24 family peptidase [Thioalkalivibrio nitratireducens]AGA34231.1 Leader peptidase (Prepilin peptidase) / N-methyltransferase [Thioalkalivibrio nitratireducens DSM 14787]
MMPWSEIPAAWTIPAVAVLGLIVGSFLNVVIHRLPRMMQREWEQEARAILEQPEAPESPRFDLWWPRSQCPHCGRGIRARENIPVFSFLLLRARCPGCGGRISWQYPLVELLTAALFAATVWHLGAGAAGLAALVFTGMLIAAAGVDARTTLLPDQLTLPLLWLGLVANLFGLFTDLESAVIGAVAGYLTLWTVYHGFRLLTGKEGMGFGDFKLLAALGAWLGWQALPLILLLASLVGAVVGIALILLLGRDRNVPIPFGPYLAAAGWLALIGGDTLIAAYLPP